MSIFDLTATLLTLAALFGWLNRRFIGLPHTTALLLLGLGASLLLVAVERAYPGIPFYHLLRDGLQQINFTEVVMDGMLAFLIFAGALNLDLRELRNRAWSVATLAVIGTTVSTILVGGAVWEVSRLIGHPLPLPWALVFGALISPTDPVAVISTLRHVAISKRLAVEMQGEALFNDGVGIVLFTLLVGIIRGGDHADPSAWQIGEALGWEAGGGLVLGLVTGYLGYRAMRSVDEYPVEVLITLAVVTGTYAIAQHLDMSGPLAMVSAGLLIGYRAPLDAMSERTKGYVSALWTLIDEVLNSLLFLLIGIEVLLLHVDKGTLLLSATVIPIVLLARLAAVTLPLLLFGWHAGMSVRNVPFLTWAGVRGGISVALALALPDDPAKPAVLVATYAVVLFSIVVQGSTLGALARRMRTD
ncbi:cation:proton antiporter [Rhodospirillum rubrum]|uniref:cation:proton antiporter n=1 Tax=Rhodospirillum rubrum TaxID=1085 RepID=UPI001A91E7E3|nr:sodium:proton antiporter [Rhodospirillum rubrum]